LREVAVLSVALPDVTGGGPNGGLSLRDEDDLDKAGAADEVFGARPFPCLTSSCLGGGTGEGLNESSSPSPSGGGPSGKSSSSSVVGGNSPEYSIDVDSSEELLYLVSPESSDMFPISLERKEGAALRNDDTDLPPSSARAGAGAGAGARLGGAVLPLEEEPGMACYSLTLSRLCSGVF
jgi:hypothetical protein